MTSLEPTYEAISKDLLETLKADTCKDDIYANHMAGTITCKKLSRG